MAVKAHALSWISRIWSGAREQTPGGVYLLFFDSRWLYCPQALLRTTSVLVLMNIEFVPITCQFAPPHSIPPNKETTRYKKEWRNNPTTGQNCDSKLEHKKQPPNRYSTLTPNMPHEQTLPPNPATKSKPLSSNCKKCSKL
nr:hypothetical protein CFP56_00915 [Quercus suber]